MFNAAHYRRMYDRFLGPLAQPVTLQINDGAGFISHAGIMAHVSAYRESDLVQGGPVQVGDLKIIILAENLPDSLRTLDQRDRVVIDGKAYGVIHWDPFTRSVGPSTVAVECTVRG